MSEMLIAFLVAVAILTALFVVVPMLHICNAGCQRFFGRKPALQETELEKRVVDLRDVA